MMTQYCTVVVVFFLFIYFFNKLYFFFIFIRSDPYVNKLVKKNVRSPYSCHELFGFDIMLDENLKPWVLEVNISPRYLSAKHSDASISDILFLVWFVMYVYALCF